MIISEKNREGGPHEIKYLTRIQLLSVCSIRSRKRRYASRAVENALQENLLYLGSLTIVRNTVCLKIPRC